VLEIAALKQIRIEPGVGKGGRLESEWENKRLEKGRT